MASNELIVQWELMLGMLSNEQQQWVCLCHSPPFLIVFQLSVCLLLPLSDRSLDLSFNHIRVIDGLSLLTNLTDLYLINNKLTKIESLSALTNLTMLELGSNRLRVSDSACSVVMETTCLKVYKISLNSLQWRYNIGYMYSTPEGKNCADSDQTRKLVIRTDKYILIVSNSQMGLPTLSTQFVL